MQLVQTACKPQVVTMVQLTAERRIFVVMKFHETRTLQTTQDAFGEAFPDREPPAKKTILANEKTNQKRLLLNVLLMIMNKIH